MEDYIVECLCCGARVKRSDWESGKYRRDQKPLCPNPDCNNAAYIRSKGPKAMQEKEESKK